MIVADFAPCMEPVKAPSDHWAVKGRWSAEEQFTCHSISLCCKRLSVLLCLATGRVTLQRLPPMFGAIDLAILAAFDSLDNVEKLVTRIRTVPAMEQTFGPPANMHRTQRRMLRKQVKVLARERKEYAADLVDLNALQTGWQGGDERLFYWPSGPATIVQTTVLLAQLNARSIRRTMYSAALLQYTTHGERDMSIDMATRVGELRDKLVERGLLLNEDADGEQ